MIFVGKYFLLQINPHWIGPHGALARFSGSRTVYVGLSQNTLHCVCVCVKPVANKLWLCIQNLLVEQFHVNFDSFCGIC